MKNKITLVVSHLLVASNLFAGGTNGGTPPAESEVPVFDSDKDVGVPLKMLETVSEIPSASLIKADDGWTLIPLKYENIRRLNMRLSARSEAALKTDTGQVFMMARYPNDRLIDVEKRAKVIMSGSLFDGKLLLPPRGRFN